MGRKGSMAKSTKAQKLSQSVKQHIEEVLSTTNDGVVAFNLQGSIIAINDEAASLLQLPTDQIINHYPWQLLPLDSIVRKRQFIKARKSFNLAKEGIAQQLTWIESKTRKLLLAYNITIYRTEIDGVSVIFAKLNDILQKKLVEQYLTHMAKLDFLTQIANRQYFDEQFQKKLKAHIQKKQHMALLLIDFDDFKVINDSLGHLVGDKLLKSAAKRMVNCLRKNDFIARFGGDEFIVLLENSNTDGAMIVAQKMQEVLCKPFTFGKQQIKITVSIGIAIYPETGETTTDLIKHADMAMYQIKKSGKNAPGVFSNSLYFMQDRKNEVIRKELQQVVENHQLYVDFQPQANLENNSIHGYEAYLRWLHPELGVILPNEFIPTAEQTGCIHKISEWIIERSFTDFLKYLASDKQTKLSLNISICQLNDPEFLKSLCRTIDKHKLSRDRIILDISEQTVNFQIEKVTQILKSFHKEHIKICLDNFGTPQVSLPKLMALNLDYLKLDAILLQKIVTSKRHRTLLKGIINMAQELDIKVIQKGIETEAQHKTIKKIAAIYGQGYYYCPPLQIEELIQRLKLDT